MATYNLTAGDDVFSGTDEADTFDGYTNGKNGGNDNLMGAGGDDTFLFANWFTGPQSGRIDGGDGTDTVVASDNAIGSLSFQNTEILKIGDAPNTFTASISQLNSFSSIENTRTSDDPLFFYLTGEGGTIDLSSVWTGKPVRLELSKLTSSIDIVATEGDDFIDDPGYFKNTIDGGKGDDFLGARFVGKHGAIALNGGEGDDHLYIGSGSFVIDGGAGIDILSASDISHAVLQNIEVIEFDGELYMRPSQFVEIKKLKLAYPEYASSVEFHFKGEGGIVDLSHSLGKASAKVRDSGMTSGITLTATRFNDVLRGSKFDDVINAGNGNDLIKSSRGFDILNGDAGDDKFTLSNAVSGKIDGGDGFDIVRLDQYIPFSYQEIGSVKFSNVEELICTDYVKATIGQLSQFDSIIFVDNDSAEDVAFFFELYGKGGRVDFSKSLTQLSLATADVGLTSGISITATKGNDSLVGSRFADTLRGGRGDDALHGGGGRDRLFGGKGDDAYGVDSKYDQVFEKAGGGRDYVASSVSYDLARNCKGQEIEGLQLVGDAEIDASGNDLDNVLQGNGASNTLKGGEGDDYFAFNTALDGKKNVDVILDFDPGDDLIFLGQSVFRSFKRDAGYYLNEKFFHDTGDGKAGRYDRILYDRKHGAVFYDADGTGTKYHAVKFAELADHPKLSADDFAIF